MQKKKAMKFVLYKVLVKKKNPLRPQQTFCET